MIRPRSLLASLGLLLTVGQLPPGSPPLSAQEILVQVVASETGEPIPTAFVTFTTEEGGALAHALTNPMGRAIFRASGPGTYRLRAEMFGRATVWSPPLRVQVDSSAQRRIELPVEAIPLPEIRVASDQRCTVRLEDRKELARVWEEARKALAIQSWTDEVGRFRFQIVSWERELDPEDLSVTSEILHDLTTTARNPIVSLPVDSLMEIGFIHRLDRRRVEYFGPDASILLSHPFLNTHCFRLEANEDDPGVIGLAFQPASEGLTDVQGTLWMDRATGHLRVMEFSYANAPKELTEGVAGGRVEFERLPDGSWIVRRWWIRIPVREATWLFGRKHLVRIREVGGVVSEITSAPGGA